MNDIAPRVTEVRFESADIPTLRRALLADAYRNSERASEYYRPGGDEDETRLAAWSGLVLAASHGEMTAALLGLLGDPSVPADLAERGRSLVGQVLDGWPEVLEGANDDVAAAGVEIPGQQQIPAATPAPLGFRVGDLVEITAKDDEDERTPPGARLIGKTGYVSEIDDNPEYPIGLTVEGWLGPVWCKSNELRHLDRRCTACDGTGQRHETDPVDGEFESTDVCDGCDGTGHVAIEAESGSGR